MPSAIASRPSREAVKSRVTSPTYKGLVTILNDLPTWWRVVDGGVEVSVRAVPGARKSGVADETSDYVRIRLAAPAVEGKANEALVRFVAEWFGVRASAVTLVSGEKARVKRVRIAGAQAPPDTTMF